MLILFRIRGMSKTYRDRGSKIIETEAGFTKIRINNAWTINSLQNTRCVKKVSRRGSIYQVRNKQRKKQNKTLSFFEIFTYSMPCRRVLQYAGCIPCRGIRAPPFKKGCHGYDTKLHLIVRIQFLSSVDYGVFLHCHRSQVFPHPESPI